MFKKIAGGMLAMAGMGLIFAAPAEAKEKPLICHPVEGKGETGTGWSLINPNEASSHIDERTGAGKHTSKDGRTDVYAVNGVCPGVPVPTTSTTTTTPSSTTTTSTTTKPTTPTETKTQPPTSTTTTPSGTTTVPPVTEPPVTETTGAPTTKPTVVVTDPRPSVTLPTEAPKPTKTSEIVVSTPDVTTTDAPHTTAVDTPRQQELAFTGTKMLYAIAGLILLAAGVLLLFVRRGLTLSRK